MNIASIGLTPDNFLDRIHDVDRVYRNTSKAALRMVLVGDEHLRIPNSSAWHIHIYSGKAWLSFEGEDIILGCCQSLDIPRSKNGAVISPADHSSLFIELRRQS